MHHVRDEEPTAHAMRRCASSGGENLCHSIRKVSESFRAIAATLLGNAPAVVANIIQGAHDRGPIVVTLPERDIEAFIRPGRVPLFAAVFLDVQLLNALAEDMNPLLRITESNHV